MLSDVYGPCRAGLSGRVAKYLSSALLKVSILQLEIPRMWLGSTLNSFVALIVKLLVTRVLILAAAVLSGAGTLQSLPLLPSVFTNSETRRFDTAETLGTRPSSIFHTGYHTFHAFDVSYIASGWKGVPNSLGYSFLAHVL